MARMRTVKPEFFRSASMGRVPPCARLLAIAMWQEADDHGRGLASAKQLAGIAFPHDDDIGSKQVERWISDLEREGHVELYDIAGTRYYRVIEWRHQHINKPGDPRYPAPPTTRTTNGARPESDVPTERNTNGTGPSDDVPKDRSGDVPRARPIARAAGHRVQVSGHRVQGSGLEPSANAVALDPPSRARGSAEAVEQAEPETQNPDGEELTDEQLREATERLRARHGVQEEQRGGAPGKLGDLLGRVTGTGDAS